MKLWIAEHLENEYIIGAFDTFDKAMYACNKIAGDIATRWEPPLAEDEMCQWVGYQWECMVFYITMRYLNNEVD